MKRTFAALTLLAACGQPAHAESLDTTVRQLTAAHIHGERDNAASVTERQQLLEDGELVAFCAEVVMPANRILNADGFESRHVAMLGFTPVHGYYPGHHVIEVWHPNRERWVVVDIDYGVMFDQSAITLPDGRVTPEPLEAGSRDTERSGAYPDVAQAVGFVVDGFVYYDPADYTPAESAILAAQQWRPFVGDFVAAFYG